MMHFLKLKNPTLTFKEEKKEQTKIVETKKFKTLAD